MTLWSVKHPVSFGNKSYIDNSYIDNIKYVVATSAFFIELCQEMVVKGFNKGYFVNTRCAVNGVPEDVWQIKITRNYHVVGLVTNFMQKIIQLGSLLGGLQQEQNKIL